MNIPNGLSFLRICAVPIFIWLLLNREMQWAFWLFVLASLTDALDGFIAKRFNMHTELGAYLDPLADKLLLVCGFIVLTVLGDIPLWITLLVTTRDIMIIGGALLYQVMTNSLRMQPMWMSKVNTTMQIILLGVVMLSLEVVPVAILVAPLTIMVAVTTLISGWQYVNVWTRQVVRREELKSATDDS
ncbi:MAG: CDP-alcohol phosphatidyltransferase family protein [Magnetococcales bacterium]|nr:CDP-alcohol phosphatidyltransferase family protein [Magnetococcales bacterium]